MCCAIWRLGLSGKSSDLKQEKETHLENNPGIYDLRAESSGKLYLAH